MARARSFAAVLAIVLIFSAANSAFAARHCTERKDKIFPANSCYEVTGRAQYSVKRNQIRIWPFGTRLHLFVVEKSLKADAMIARVNAHRALVAQFKVCPISYGQTHRIQLVCVEDVSKPEFETR
jgi:hypothetical protein